MNVLTSTNTLNSMIAHEDIAGAASVLLSGGLVLFPTDTTWMVGCDLYQEVSCQKLLQLIEKPLPFGIEILTGSLEMLKYYVPGLHPKLETLLFYHTRPLSIVLRGAHLFPEALFPPKKAVVVRIIRDPFSAKIIQELGGPILAAFPTMAGHPIPAHFGEISSSILEKMTYVARYRQTEKRAGKPPVVVTLSKKDEMVFLSE